MAARAVLSVALICWLGPDSFAEVIHTTDGRCHVGAILEEGDPLSLQTLDGPLELARDEILTIEGRAELMRSLRASQRSLQATDWSGSLRLADWALRKGLFDTALDLADQSLEIASRLEERPAVDLPMTLFSLPPGGFAELDLPADALAWKLLGHCAGKSPSRALIAGRRLQLSGERTVLIETLFRGLKDPRAAFRRAAVKLLGATHPEGTIERVIERMLFDRDETVRMEACRAVKAYQDEGVVFPLLRALGQSRAELRLAAMDAIEMLEERRAVGALIRHMRLAGGSGMTRNHVAFTTQTSIVSDFDVEIAQASVIADPNIEVVQDGSVLDVGVAGVYERAIPRGEVVRIGALLEYLTGETFGTDVQAWESWLGSQQKVGE